MRKTVLFISMSIDGYIADKNGDVDWLEGQEEKESNLDSYNDFIKNTDTIIMGWNTYHQIITKLSKDNWIYEQQTCYVVTHREKKSTNNIIFTDKKPSEIVKTLKKKQGKNIWICGGANTVNQLIKDNLIDEYYISVIPTILGEGIPLFQKNRELKLKLIGTKTYNGITDLIYILR